MLWGKMGGGGEWQQSCIYTCGWCEWTISCAHCLHAWKQAKLCLCHTAAWCMEWIVTASITCSTGCQPVSHVMLMAMHTMSNLMMCPSHCAPSQHSKNQSEIAYSQSYIAYNDPISAGYRRHVCFESRMLVNQDKGKASSQLQRGTQTIQTVQTYKGISTIMGLVGAQPVDEKLPDWWACLRTLCTKRSLALSMLDKVDSASSITRTCIHSITARNMGY